MTARKTDRITLTLDLTAVFLAEAAEAEMATLAVPQPLSALTVLGCMVLRAAERQQVAQYMASLKREK